MTGPIGGAQPRAPGTVTVALCGDVMLGRGIDQILPHPGDPRLYEPYVASAVEYVALAERANGPIPRPVDFAYVWGDALEVFLSDRLDARIVNLETSITTSEDHVPKGINYKMHPENVRCLNAAAIDCCVLANNHVLDWGLAGLFETLDTLARAGIRSAGAGRDAAQAQAPAVLNPPGTGRVLVFAFGSVTSGIPTDWAAGVSRPGVNLLTDFGERTVARIARQAESARRPGDLLVASIHWGGNWGYAVPREQRNFAHALIDRAGFHVVHGHSSHHAKGIEVYKGCPILYGCGDFLTDYEGISGYEAFRDDLAVLYLCRFCPSTGRLSALTLVPYQIRNFRLNAISPEDAVWLRDVLARESARFGTGLSLEADATLSVQWG